MIKAASFNVNSLRARMPVVLQWLAGNKPDVLCVQETKVQDADFPLEPIEKAGYSCAFKGQKSYNGVAILSRHRIDAVECGLDDEPRDGPRLIKAEIRGITIVNTYVPQGESPESEKFRYKLDWFKRLERYFRSRFKSADMVLWMGDLNIAPEPVDVYDPEGLRGHVCFHPEVHKALDETMQWGFIDVFRMHCKDGGQYTFWDYREPNALKRNHGWRLDHILATGSLAKKCTACSIDRGPRMAERPSDHTPVVAEFNL